MKNSYGYLKKALISENGLTVLQQRFLRKGPDGKPSETVEQMFKRVADAVASVELKSKRDNYSKLYFRLLASLAFVPNSPTFTGAGTPLGQLAACFVLPIADDMGKVEGGIFSTLRDAALVQQTGGGIGFSFSHLRPKGDRVAASGGVASGPVGFLRVYDAAFGEVAQGGTRRGANMAVLRVDHPDILDFIACKSSEGRLTNFNISVAVTDAFMQAVEKDGDFDLKNPRDGKPVKTVKARQIFVVMTKAAHQNGEPGILFLDVANRFNPVPHLYSLEATNPCGEQWLGPYENCCLGSINLIRHLTDDGRFDWEALRETIELATRFLDGVVDANKYVPSVPSLKEAALKCRRIGLGIMGLADALFVLRIHYGSLKAQEFASQMAEFLRFYAMQTSIDLAKEKGSFPAIAGSIYDRQNLQWQSPRPLVEHQTDFGRGTLDWQQIVDGIKEHGIRNAAQTTIAPTGTISTVAGVEGYGCEPAFALAYRRHVVMTGEDLSLNYVSPLFLAALQKSDLSKEDIEQKVLPQVLQSGSCQRIEVLSRSMRDVFVVASDLTWEEHVRMQAVLQAFVDNSISKTINFPADATIDDIAQAYFLAWKLGCKGLTVYRQGSREEVILETREIRRQKKLTVLTQGDVVKPRDRVLNGRTYRWPTPVGTAFIVINNNGDGEPFEVFATVGHAGSDVMADAEAIGRLISLCLRTAPAPKQRVIEMVDQLRGIGGGRSVGLGPNRVTSLADAVAQALSEHLNLPQPSPKETSEVYQGQQVGDLCPECGQASLVKEEGCRKCYFCGYSQC